MFSLSVAEYRLLCSASEVPGIYYTYYRAHARFVDEVDLEETYYDGCFFAVSKEAEERPLLAVAQRYSPGIGAGFHPGLILIPETRLLLIGAGERLLAYDLAIPQRLWEDRAEMGFWSWARYGSTVLMSAELEFAAWDAGGNKLWTAFVEPPWHYTVRDDVVSVDVMGMRSAFPLRSGPAGRI
jgi:hypothetical protein